MINQLFIDENNISDIFMSIIKEYVKSINKEISAESLLFITHHIEKSNNKYYIIQSLNMTESLLNGLKLISQHFQLIQKYRDEIKVYIYIIIIIEIRIEILSIKSPSIR